MQTNLDELRTSMNGRVAPFTEIEPKVASKHLSDLLEKSVLFTQIRAMIHSPFFSRLIVVRASTSINTPEYFGYWKLDTSAVCELLAKYSVYTDWLKGKEGSKEALLATALSECVQAVIVGLGPDLKKQELINVSDELLPIHGWST